MWVLSGLFAWWIEKVGSQDAKDKQREAKTQVHKPNLGQPRSKKKRENAEKKEKEGEKEDGDVKITVQEVAPAMGGDAG
jgi:hypothetical protein